MPTSVGFAFHDMTQPADLERGNTGEEVHNVTLERQQKRREARSPLATRACSTKSFNPCRVIHHTKKEAR
jgi:hypothetical protein